MATKNKNATAALATKLIAGVGKHFPKNSKLAFGSATFTPAQLTAQLQTLVTLRGTVNGAHAALHTATMAETAQAPALNTLLSDLIAFVMATFGKSPDVLADFGLAPKKAPTPLTVTEKAAAAAKRDATRAARGTTSKKQKLAIHGDVVGVTVTPVTATSPVVTEPEVEVAPTTGTAATNGTAPKPTA